MENNKFKWPCEWMYELVKQWVDEDFEVEGEAFIKRVDEVLYEINTAPPSPNRLKVSFKVDPDYDIRDHWNDEDIKRTRFKLTVGIYMMNTLKS